MFSNDIGTKHLHHKSYARSYCANRHSNASIDLFHRCTIADDIRQLEEDNGTNDMYLFHVNVHMTDSEPNIVDNTNDRLSNDVCVTSTTAKDSLGIWKRSSPIMKLIDHTRINDENNTAMRDAAVITLKGTSSF
jgi:hypothetical protein